MTTTSAIRLGLIALCGVTLMGIPIFARRLASLRTYPTWALITSFGAGGTSLVYLGLGWFVHSLGIHDRWLPLLTHLRSLIGGVGIGMGLTLILWYLLSYSRTATPALDRPSDESFPNNRNA